MEGKVKFFNERKGYGFVIEQESSKEYFFHVTKVKKRVKNDDEVTFDLQDTDKGTQAVNVKPLK